MIIRWEEVIELANKEAIRTKVRQRIYSEKSFFANRWFYYYKPIENNERTHDA